MTASPTPLIKKADLIFGKTLNFRDANVDDAGFILSLRTDDAKSQYLNAVSGILADQQDWLDLYAKSNNQAYFIIEYQNKPIGTVRLYDPRGVSFCWGSWIMVDERPPHVGIESALMVYAYATEYLGFSAAHLDVRKDNMRVWKFHEMLGAHRVAETEKDYLYKIDGDAIAAVRLRYQKFLETICVTMRP